MRQSISLTVNGRPIEAVVEPRTHLADFIREALRLTGTHLGCEHGVCGACTVLIDGAPMRSCIAYAITCHGAEVRTIEGFDDDPLMQALRDAFACHHALQCGYCTPGMLITAYDVVQRLPDADETRVREELSGNLCRCTGYVGIVAAVKSALAKGPASGAVTHAAAMLPSGAGSRVDSPPAAPARHPAVAPADSSSQHSMQATPPAPPRAAPIPVEPSVAAHGRRPAGSLDAKPSHEIMLAIAPDALWPVLHDVATVVRCLPGASLAGPADADPISLEMRVAIGPMRVRFEGTAHVEFDHGRHAGIIEGRGHDPRTRSSGEGRIEFLVQPSQTSGSVLRLSLQYSLRGPLAQFSRGAVVDAVVEQLLGRFAENLATLASGRDVAASRPLSGLGLVMAAFRSWLKKGFARRGR